MESNNTSLSPQSRGGHTNAFSAALSGFADRLLEKTDAFDESTKKFIQRRGHISKVSSIVALFIVLVAIIGGICFLTLFHEMPGFGINNVIAPKNPDDNQFNVDFGSPKRSPSINISIQLNVTVMNRNGFRLYFPEVGVDVYHPQLMNVSLGKTVVRDLELMPHKSVYITVPINMTYFLRDDPNVVIANNLMGACSIPNGKSETDQNIDIALILSPKLKLFNLFPTDVEKMYRYNSFNCPYKLPRTMQISGMNVNLDMINWKALQRSDLVNAFLPTIASLATA